MATESVSVFYRSFRPQSSLAAHPQGTGWKTARCDDRPQKPHQPPGLEASHRTCTRGRQAQGGARQGGGSQSLHQVSVANAPDAGCHPRRPRAPSGSPRPGHPRAHQPEPTRLTAAMPGATTTRVIIPQGLLYKLCARRIERSRADEADDGAEHEHVASPSSGGGGRPPSGGNQDRAWSCSSAGSRAQEQAQEALGAAKTVGHALVLEAAGLLEGHDHEHGVKHHVDKVHQLGQSGSARRCCSSRR